MKRALHLACLLLLIGAAIFIWMKLFPSPEQQIRKRMVELQELASFDASDGNFAALAAREKLGALFTGNAQVRVEVRGMTSIALTSRLEIKNAVALARRELVQLDVEFLDVVVTLAADGRTARVEATGKARQASDGELWIQVLRFEFVETDDGWLISLVETVPLFSMRHLSSVQPAPAAASA